MAYDSSKSVRIRRCPMKQHTLLQSIQDIMREYPRDAQILHELVQNAEDAKASVMEIMYDRRQINPPGDLGKFLQSPALCVYKLNDRVFGEEDWDGIKSVRLSQKEEKTDKIGRFGQGFKSVFHLTDNPVVVSGDTMLILEPLEVNEECASVSLSEIGDINNTGIFESFGLNCNSIKDGFYPATLFWFPLRSKGSKLSENVCTDVKMTQILSLFEEDAAIILLFMKYLTNIKIHNSTQLSNTCINIQMYCVQNEKKI